MGSEAMIELAGVERTYAGASTRVQALRDVHLSVAQGEIVAVLGPSGSGKTTLLGIIGGLERPDRGSVHVADVDVAALDRRELMDYRLRSVGFVFQAVGLIPLMSALENTALPLQLMGRDERTAFGLAADALELVGLNARIRHRAHELSGGEQQRVALARALVKEPKVLLADEPTGQLDSETSAQIVDLLVSLRGRTTILVASHDEAVAARADRVLHLNDGVIKAGEPVLS